MSETTHNLRERLRLEKSLQQVLQRIAAYELKYAREKGAVQLVAVSKTQPADAVRAVCELGQRRFGENYLQEAIAKQALLADCDLEWHFIGPIQSNKTRELAACFNWVHSVDRARIAQRLHDQRDPALGVLNVLIQVNLSVEASKSGCSLDALPALAAVIAGLSHLRLCGLMAIPAPATDVASQRPVFRQLRLARDQLAAAGHQHCRELSMGMSADFEAAIAEGTTLVRIGSDIFGARKTAPK